MDCCSKSDTNCDCCQCHTLVITDYSLCTFCPGRPYSFMGQWRWTKGWNLVLQDAGNASSVFKTSSWQALASHHWGPNGCGSDTNVWKHYVNTILLVKLIEFVKKILYDLNGQRHQPSYSKSGPLNMTLCKHLVVILLKYSSSGCLAGIISSFGWVDPYVCGKDKGDINTALDVQH